MSRLQERFLQEDETDRIPDGSKFLERRFRQFRVESVVNIKLTKNSRQLTSRKAKEYCIFIRK